MWEGRDRGFGSSRLKAHLGGPKPLRVQGLPLGRERERERDILPHCVILHDCVFFWWNMGLGEGQIVKRISGERPVLLQLSGVP